MKEFFKAIIYPVEQIYFVILNWLDDDKLKDDMEIVIKASGLMFLFQEDTLSPFDYFHRDNEADVEDIMLDNVSQKTKAS